MLTQGYSPSSFDATQGIKGQVVSSYSVPTLTTGMQSSTFFLGSMGFGFARSSYSQLNQISSVSFSSYATQIDYYATGTGFTGKLVTPDNPVPH